MTSPIWLDAQDRRMGLAVAVPIVGLVARVWVSGWEVFLLAPVYLIITMVHIGFHSTIATTAQHGRRQWAMTLGSHVAILIAFLLQYHGGDGPGWLTITGLLHGNLGSQEARPPAWLPITDDDGILWNLGLFIPAVLTYIAITITRRTAGLRPIG